MHWALKYFIGLAAVCVLSVFVVGWWAPVPVAIVGLFLFGAFAVFMTLRDQAGEKPYNPTPDD